MAKGLKQDIQLKTEIIDKEKVLINKQYIGNLKGLKLKLDLNSIVPCLSGPKRPQDKIELPKVAKSFDYSLKNDFKINTASKVSAVKNKDFTIDHGHVAIAAITSCTNTCLLYTSPSPRDATLSRMPSSA